MAGLVTCHGNRDPAFDVVFEKRNRTQRQRSPFRWRTRSMLRCVLALGLLAAAVLQTGCGHCCKQTTSSYPCCPTAPVLVPRVAAPCPCPAPCELARQPVQPARHRETNPAPGRRRGERHPRRSEGNRNGRDAVHLHVPCSVCCCLFLNPFPQRDVFFSSILNVPRFFRLTLFLRATLANTVRSKIATLCRWPGKKDENTSGHLLLAATPGAYS